ncbi:MAG TPA: hypothetical protein VNU45_07365 [Rummeliibacillus sp.]|nr:hypothetical protein [Rummeliibacillus sp.]
MNEENKDKTKMSVKQQVLLGIILIFMVISFVFYVFLGIDSKWLQLFNLFICVLWGILLFGIFKKTNGFS